MKDVTDERLAWLSEWDEQGQSEHGQIARELLQARCKIKQLTKDYIQVTESYARLMSSVIGSPK